MKSKLLIVWIVFFVLGIGESFSLFHGEDNVVTEMPEYENPESQVEKMLPELPLLEVPSIYQGYCGSKEYAVFVETRNANEMKGHFLALSDEMSDTVSFRLSYDGEGLRFFSQDVDVCLKVSELQTDSQKIEGYLQDSFLNYLHFSFSIYKMPQFVECDSTRYQESRFGVKRIDQVHFANVDGYWTELDNHINTSFDMIMQLNRVLNEHNLDLFMDVYLPENDVLAKRPFVMLIHGGLFYYGTRKDITVSRLCEHLASLGYVAASIDYRIGFQPTKVGIERSGYRAIQDAHAAMRFVTANQDAFGIDTSMMFVGGCSAGSITALGLAFMTNETRPKSTRASLLNTELGDIETDGNDIDVRFSLKGVVDMWGALPNLGMLDGKNIPIVAFHGDADDVVPYGYDYPFGKAGRLKKMLFNKMYGSSCIVEQEKELGVKSVLYTFEGCNHSPQMSGDTLSGNFYIIQDKMCAFLNEIIREKKPQIVKRNGWYQLDGEVFQRNWAVEGGLIVVNKQSEVKVVWMGNAPQCKLKVSGIQKYGIGFMQEVWIK